jgi:hypothetical protein
MLLTVRWGQFKPSQPPRRVARWGQIRPSQRHPPPPQAGPLQAALPGPNQAVTARCVVASGWTLQPGVDAPSSWDIRVTSWEAHFAAMSSSRLTFGAAPQSTPRLLQPMSYPCSATRARVVNFQRLPAPTKAVAITRNPSSVRASSWLKTGCRLLILAASRQHSAAAAQLVALVSRCNEH